MNTYQAQVETLKNQIIAAFGEFFGTGEGVRELYLKNQPASTMSEAVTITGVLRSQKYISLIGEGEHADEPSYERIESCHVSDLAYVLDELKANRFYEVGE